MSNYDKQDDFEYDFKNEYPEYDYDKIIDIFDNWEKNEFEDCVINGFKISCLTEKIDQLNENVFIHLKNDADNIEFWLEYENGINNGTQLNDYSFSEDIAPKTRTIEVLKDIEFDYEAWMKAYNKPYNENQKRNLELVFNANFKDKILKKIREKSYDNYVTGGSANYSSHYSDFFKEMRSKGAYFTCIYKEETYLANLKSK